MTPDPTHIHAIDRLVISGRRVFGWGWAAHRERAVKSVDVRIEGEGWQHRLPTNFGLSRDDVEKNHPRFVNAAACGFVITGWLPQAGTKKVTLEIALEGGERIESDVTHAMENRYAQRRFMRRLSWVAHSVWRRLKRGDLVGIVTRARAQSYSAPTLDDISIVQQLLPELRKARDICVMFDHNMGGGANQYRRNVIGERLDAGQTVLLCTYNMAVLEYRLHLFAPGKDEQIYRITTFQVLERVLEQVAVAEIFVNSPVSFDEPLMLAEWLARMRTEYPRTRLTVTAHDYLAVCPSFVLLNADGKYCGIPDISECNNCLKRHPASYVALSPPGEMGPWRALWGRCLGAADEVRCFSESTRRHLLRAYPTLDPSRLTLVPHKVDYLPPRLPKVDRSAALVIGIMGEISPQKGALVVKEMVERIEREHPGTRMVILGSLNTAIKSDRLTVTGPYQREQLVELVERHGINMFFFPSVWPETFSYVVAEMIALGVPIVAFDLGAPGERLRGYGLARLCGETSAAAALATIAGFHRDLALQEAAAE
jgi:glycosyltransferase involved in cell wall biosynthesis